MAQIAFGFDFRIECGIAQDLGRARVSNQDASLVLPEIGAFAVADGMGGHRAGDVAAGIAIDAVREALSKSSARRVADAYVARPDLETRRAVLSRLRSVVELANQRVREAAQADETRRGMGTTLDVAWLVRDHAFLAHAGDGRVYLARARAVLQLTHDHAQLEAWKAEGRLRPHGKTTRSPLVNAVGLSEAIAVDTLFVDLTRGDRLLLCTDGVHGQIERESEIGELLRQGDSVEHAARALVARAARYGQDNATAVVVAIGDRFVARVPEDRGLVAADLERAAESALLSDLRRPQVLAALAAAVQVELNDQEPIPCVVANDLVAYVVLDGVVRFPDGRRVGTGALLFPQSLVGVWTKSDLPRAEQTVRLLRVRADDFAEVCRDPTLASPLYRRLAEHLARAATRASELPAPDPDAGSGSGVESD